ncbi:MAG: alanine racemase C-terminal domain-containing protein, partial [Clostridia bacterium]
KGQGVSYGHTFVAQRNMRIAVVACGYADGYPLAASNRAFAMVEGQCARVVGKVCMDMLMLDISDIVGVEVGAKVLLWQCDKDSPVPLKKLATMVASSQYELLTRIGNRVKRVYIQ